MQEVYFVEFRMKLYVQLMILFVISLIGEGISSFFHLPIPGSIIGLIILFLALDNTNHLFDGVGFNQL